MLKRRSARCFHLQRIRMSLRVRKTYNGASIKETTIISPQTDSCCFCCCCCCCCCCCRLPAASLQECQKLNITGAHYGSLLSGFSVIVCVVTPQRHANSIAENMEVYIMAWLHNMV